MDVLPVRRPLRVLEAAMGRKRKRMKELGKNIGDMERNGERIKWGDLEKKE